MALIGLDAQPLREPLGLPIPGGVQIFNLAALVVFTSIIVHGLTDTPGATWIARASGPRRQEEGDAPALV